MMRRAAKRLDGKRSIGSLRFHAARQRHHLQKVLVADDQDGRLQSSEGSNEGEGAMSAGHPILQANAVSDRSRIVLNVHRVLAFEASGMSIWNS
jgi:hypothetical protein